jgi:hypothetical protein
MTIELEPEGGFFLNVFHALPRGGDRRGVAGDQQDAGDDLKDEVEQEQAAERRRPARATQHGLEKEMFFQLAPTGSRTEESSRWQLVGGFDGWFSSCH